MTVYLIRHAQSEGNIGLRTTIHSDIRLSAEGEKQAEELAAKTDFCPQLIVMSPFLRARQTAMPLCRKYPAVPTEIWPVEEFTFLDADRCNNTTPEERRPWVEAYFKRNDPDYVDGKGAESFAMLLARAEDMLTRLRALPAENTTLVITHGNFIRATMLLLTRSAPLLPAEILRLPVPENTSLTDITPFLRADGAQSCK